MKTIWILLSLMLSQAALAEVESKVWGATSLLISNGDHINYYYLYNKGVNRDKSLNYIRVDAGANVTFDSYSSVRFHGDIYVGKSVTINAQAGQFMMVASKVKKGKTVEGYFGGASIIATRTNSDKTVPEVAMFSGTLYTSVGAARLVRGDISAYGYIFNQQVHNFVLEGDSRLIASHGGNIHLTETSINLNTYYPGMYSLSKSDGRFTLDLSKILTSNGAQVGGTYTGSLTINLPSAEMALLIEALNGGASGIDILADINQTLNLSEFTIEGDGHIIDFYCPGDHTGVMEYQVIIPEPATATLSMLALAALLLRRRRRLHLTH